MDGRRVAIACQGGGSHTAFTAGVLSRVLRDGPPPGHRVVGLSGTSGGAVCAALAWRAFAGGDPADAARRLRGYWRATSADTPVELAANAGLVGAAWLQDAGLLPLVSPYDLPVSPQEAFRSVLAPWLDLGGLGPVPAGTPPLVTGAVDVLSGRFRAFDSRAEPVTVDQVLASASIPTLFPAAHLPDGVYWDGLFSQNPPVRELLDAGPDELWVVQINATAVAAEPRSVLDIADRRNELAGNLSLFQELRSIEKINQLLAEGVLADGRYRPITVRVLELSRSRASRELGTASKVNRDRRFLDGLIDQGERQADEFLTALRFEAAWRTGDDAALAATLADDLELVCEPPFAPGVLRGAAAREFLTGQARPHPTRPRHTGDRVRWPVTGAARGSAEGDVDAGVLTRLRLGAP